MSGPASEHCFLHFGLARPTFGCHRPPGSARPNCRHSGPNFESGCTKFWYCSGPQRNSPVALRICSAIVRFCAFSPGKRCNAGAPQLRWARLISGSAWANCGESARPSGRQVRAAGLQGELRRCSAEVRVGVIARRGRLLRLRMGPLDLLLRLAGPPTFTGTVGGFHGCTPEPRICMSPARPCRVSERHVCASNRPSALPRHRPNFRSSPWRPKFEPVRPNFGAGHANVCLPAQA